MTRRVTGALLLAAVGALGTACNTRVFSFSDPCVIGPPGGQVTGCTLPGAESLLAIDLPTGALDQAVRFTVEPYQGELPPGVVAGTAYTVTTDPPVAAFEVPIRLAIQLPNDASLPRPDAPEWLRLVSFAPDATTLTGTWRSRFDADARRVLGETTHLSVYAVADLAVVEGTAASASPPESRVDLLFVLDNSTSMIPKQTSLMAFFPRFMEHLQQMTPPLDLHVGIITSDLGAGPQSVVSCETPGGDKGMLQNEPLGATCETAHLLDPDDRFLVYRPDLLGGPPETNFSGSLADAFSCYAAVGMLGCGFEHHLGAVRAALDLDLDPCHPGTSCTAELNAGFLRPDAALAVVILADEDDCSAPASSLLFDPAQTSLDSELGPLTSYRCFQFGNLCGGADPGREPGPRESCEPGTFLEDRPELKLTPVEELAAFLKGLKPHPRMVSVAVMAGPPTPVAVVMAPGGYPKLEPSCQGGLGEAYPAPRLHKLVSLFDNDRAIFVPLCAEDLAPAMAQVGVQVRDASVVGWCLDVAPVDVDPAPGQQADCLVETDLLGALPRCDDAAAGTTCFEVREATGCHGGFMVEVLRSEPAKTVGSQVTVQCATLPPG